MLWRSPLSLALDATAAVDARELSHLRLSQLRTKSRYSRTLASLRTSIATKRPCSVTGVENQTGL